MAEFDQERMNVGAGWQPLVADLHRQLTELLGDYDLLQIKEKFGGLRYYFRVPDGVSDEVRAKAYEYEELAEAKSFEVCEICGKPAECEVIAGSHYIRTLCDLHKKEEAERIEAYWEERKKEEADDGDRNASPSDS